MGKTDTNIIRILVTGGGTGGHLFPAVATAQEFKRRMPETEVLFVGTRRKVDTSSLAVYGFASKSISCYGLKGKKLLELMKALAVLPWSCFQALVIMRSFRPHIVFGVGGYVTGPVVATAKLLGITTVIHEQNSVPGLANRKLGRIVDRVCLSLPESGELFPISKIVYTGNPVRSTILELTRSSKKERNLKKTVLVLGGSQGAQAVNRLVVRALETFSEQQLSLMRVVHQTGAKDLEAVQDMYQNIGVEVDVRSFITEMHKVYEDTDLVVSRAGATTLSELAVLGKPVVLIPFPFAADNHQEKNANYYAAAGGAILFKENELTGEKLAETIWSLLEDNKRRQEMADSMKERSFPDAAGKIVECCLDAIKRSSSMKSLNKK